MSGEAHKSFKSLALNAAFSLIETVASSVLILAIASGAPGICLQMVNEVTQIRASAMAPVNMPQFTNRMPFGTKAVPVAAGFPVRVSYAPN